jgi:hypothetical protein
MNPIHTLTLHFKIYSNIILPFTLGSSKWSLPFMLSDKKPRETKRAAAGRSPTETVYNSTEVRQRLQIWYKAFDITYKVINCYNQPYTSNFIRKPSNNIKVFIPMYAGQGTNVSWLEPRPGCRPCAPHARTVTSHSDDSGSLTWNHI